MNRHRYKKLLIVIAMTFLSACSAVKINKQVVEPIVETTISAEDTIVIIYNHGTRNPRKQERCKAPYNQVPASLAQLTDHRIKIYFLCSHATEGAERGQAGNQVYARMYEIEQAMDKLIAQGIRPEHLFVAGHSKGAWASLMLMDKVNEKFNAAILFAPALANRASQEDFPWWRNEVRPKQIKQMLMAREIDALIFAYTNDDYNRPEDLKFITDKFPQTVTLIEVNCDGVQAHNTHLNDCRSRETKSIISNYIQQQINESLH